MSEKQPLKVVQWSKSGPYGENSKNQVMKNATVVIYKNKKCKKNHIDKSEEVKLMWWCRKEQLEMVVETDDCKTVSASLACLLQYISLF